MFQACFRPRILLAITAILMAGPGCDFFFDLDEVALMALDAEGDTRQADVGDAGDEDITDVAHGDADPSSDDPSSDDASSDGADLGDTDNTGDIVDVVHEDTADTDASESETDTHSPDVAVPLDTAEDIQEDIAEDIQEDIAEDIEVDAEPPGPICPTDFGTYDAPCSLVAQDCSPGDSCNLRFVFGFDLPQPRCGSPWGPLQVGDLCPANPTSDAERCRAGAVCASWNAPDSRARSCSAFCLMSTNAGCGTDAYCTSHSLIRHIPDSGLCVPRCDPYETGVCGDGRSCIADYQYVAPPSTQAVTCFAEFRCVSAGAPASGDYMSACFRAAHHVDGNGCGPELSCYPIAGVGERCVKPCREQVDCDNFLPGSICEVDDDDFGLSYCRMP